MVVVVVAVAFWHVMLVVFPVVDVVVMAEGSWYAQWDIDVVVLVVVGFWYVLQLVVAVAVVLLVVGSWRATLVVVPV